MDVSIPPRYPCSHEKRRSSFPYSTVPGFIFRAFHALPPLTRKSDGLPVGAVSGFCNMLWKLLTDARDTSVGVTPTHLAVIFDYSAKDLPQGICTMPTRPIARHRLMELIPQFGLIRDATRAFNLPCIETGRVRGRRPHRHLCPPGAKRTGAGRDDRLLRQGPDAARDAERPHVRQHEGQADRHPGGHREVGRAARKDDRPAGHDRRFGGQCPGIPGIGPKTAAQLAGRNTAISTRCWTRAHEIKQAKRRENILANADLARLSRQLVTLRTDTPLDARSRRPRSRSRRTARKSHRLPEGDGIHYADRAVWRRPPMCDASAIEPAASQSSGAADAHGPDLDDWTVAACRRRPGCREQLPVRLPSRPSVAPAEAADARRTSPSRAPRSFRPALPSTTLPYVTIRDLATLDSMDR